MLPYSRQSPYRLLARTFLGQSEEKKTYLHHCITRNLQLTVAQQPHDHKVKGLALYRLS